MRITSTLFPLRSAAKINSEKSNLSMMLPDYSGKPLSLKPITPETPRWGRDFHSFMYYV